MILDALVHQFTQRFQHEKRAQVCLWFDEKGEFGPLLPALRAQVAAIMPPPFSLLEYDPEAFHGQIWIKHEIHTALAGLPPEERLKRRFVIFLPLPEERLRGPDERGAHHMELLMEYRVAGLVWRIDGKIPTLFAFLRNAGVSLPDNPSDQRKLWFGGRESLLAKYSAKFAGRPREFWETTLTPELAQSRLLGDVDQTILDAAVVPEATFSDLREKGLEREYLEAVKERYGFECGAEDPGQWVQELVTVLALTETYLGYGEPEGFPFAGRLPIVSVRQNHVLLLRRWLRDAESRPAWDQWIQKAEAGVDLSGWAKDRKGLSFGFPHLVRQRWKRTLEAFEGAAAKLSETRAFFQEYGPVLDDEARFAQASHIKVGAWDLLATLGRFLNACVEAKQRLEKEEGTEGLARLYVDTAHMIDGQHIHIRQQAMDEELPVVARVADRTYADYTNALSQKFFDALAVQGEAEIPGIPSVTVRLEKELWHAKGRRAVIIVDGLRYDCAHAVKAALPGQDVSIEPVMAALPAVTSVGMTSLLPISGAELGFEHAGNHLKPKVYGKDMAIRQNRVSFLADFGADCRDIEKVESEKKAPSEFTDLLVVFGHDDLDHIGHGSAEGLIRHLQIEVDRLARLVRKLHRWGFPVVHIVTDHGFILLGEEWLPPEVPCDKAWCHVMGERFALVPANTDLPLKAFPFGWDKEVRIALPPGMAFFKAEKSFSHGGATLQELIIPHLVSKTHVPKAKRPGVEVVLPTYTLMQSSVRVTLRAKLPKGEKPQQMDLFAGSGERTLTLDVLREDKSGRRVSVLPGQRSKEIRLGEGEGAEVAVTLFFDTGVSLEKGGLLDLNIRDPDTEEQFPPGGIKLTVGRAM